MKRRAVIAFALATNGCAPASVGGRSGESAAAAPAPRRDCRAAEEVEVEPPAAPGLVNPRLIEADFTIVPTREISPCVLSGTLAADLPLYAREDASEPFVRAQFLQVDSLGIAAVEGTRAKLRGAWPLRMLAWVDVGSFPWALSRSLDLTGGRYWLARGARVRARSSAKSGRAILSRPYPSEWRTPEFTGAELRAEQPCSMLALPVEGLFDRSHGPNDGWAVGRFDRWVDVAAGTELHAAPGARPHAVLPAMTSLAVVGERESWVEVRSFESLGRASRGGVDFQGWVRRSLTSPGLRAALAFGPIWLAATHRSSVEIPVRGAPVPSAPVVGTIPVDVPFRAVQFESAHVEVHLPGLARGGLWISDTELCSAKRLHARAESAQR